MTGLSSLAVLYDVINALNTKGEGGLAYLSRILISLLGVILFGGAAFFWTATRSIEKK